MMSARKTSQVVRRLLPFVLAPLVVLMAALPSLAEAITDYQSTITVKPDAMLDVVETETVDFGDAERHGILRFIPIAYRRNGGNYTIDLKLKSIEDGRGNRLPYTESRQGSDIIFKIGDRNRTVSGVNVYRIHYTVRRAINFFDGEPEIYWNVTGDESNMPIRKATAQLILPISVNSAKLPVASYVGVHGSRGTASSSASGNVVTFSARDLQPREGLTVVVRLPKGSIQPPSPQQEFLWFALDWWPLFFFPIGTASVMTLLYWYCGRDHLPEMPVSVEWNPPRSMSPAEVGTLIDESCDMEDVVSTLIDLAARGYLKIRETISNSFLFLSTKDFVFTRLEEPNEPAGLLPHERAFLDALFTGVREYDSVRLSELKGKFSTHLAGIRNKIYESLVQKGLFTQSPEQVRNGWIMMACLAMLIGFAFSIGGKEIALGAGLLVSGVILLSFARAMPARTRRGCEELHKCKSFQRFVKLAEKERIKKLAAEDPTIFGRLLPYAMVLGAADQWAEAFKDLMVAPPDWYEPYGWGNTYVFNTNSFVSDLGHGMNTMGQTFGAPPPSSATGSTAGGGGSGFSGGFSGGGFGGGGTSSW